MASRPWLETLRSAGAEFVADRARRLSAGLAYYALFALAPSIMLAAAIAGALVGQEAAEGELQSGLARVFGDDIGDQLEKAVAALWEQTDSSNLALVSGLVVVYSASILFVAWRDALEVIWNVPAPSDLRSSITARAVATLVPVIAGLLLALSLVVQLVMSFVTQLVNLQLLDVTLNLVGNLAPALSAIAAVGLLYRYSSLSRRPAWRDVWPATAFVAIALAVTSWGYGIYLRYFGTSSVAGAAGSVLLALLVIYYGAQILLFGAEIIKVRRATTVGGRPDEGPGGGDTDLDRAPDSAQMSSGSGGTGQTKADATRSIKNPYSRPRTVR